MHPESGLKGKVKGFQFSQKIDVLDPVSHVMDSKPMKPFMVNQLQMAIEREQLILSPFDETLHKQLVDYEVKKISANGLPIFTDKNEHFVDALGLAFLAFALEFPDIAKTIEKTDFTSKIIGEESPLKKRAQGSIQSVKNGFGAANPWFGLRNGTVSAEDAADPREVDKPKFFHLSLNSIHRGDHASWGSRSNLGGGNRRMF